MEMKKLVGGSVLIAGVFALLWLLGNWAMPSLVPPVQIVPVAGAFLAIIVAVMYGKVFPGFLSCTPGAKRGQGNLGLIAVIAVLAGLATLGLYLAFIAPAQPAPQSVAAPATTATPVLPAGAGTGTFTVQGYANSVALQPQACPQVTQGFTQTLTLAAADASSGVAVTALTSRQTYDLSSGEIYPGSGGNGNNQTSQGEAIKVLTNGTGRIATISAVRTGCAESSPKLVTKIKAFDTSMNLTAVNPNSYTTNDAAARVTFTAATAATKTFLLKVTPSANDLYLAGGDNNEFVILYNASNTTASYDSGNFGATLGQGWVNSAGQSVAGSQCTQLQLPATPSGLGGNYIVALKCAGDFKGTDAGTAYEIQYKMAVSSQWAGDSVTTGTWNIVPYSYYVRLTTQAGQAPRGSVQPGVVNDAGVMPDNTPRQLHVYLN